MYKKRQPEENWLGSLAKAYQELSVYLGLGVQLAVTMVIMFFAGKYLDEYLNTSPLFIIVFSIFGGFAGTYNFIKAANDLNKKRKKIRNKKEEDGD